MPAPSCVGAIRVPGLSGIMGPPAGSCFDNGLLSGICDDEIINICPIYGELTGEQLAGCFSLGEKPPEEASGSNTVFTLQYAPINGNAQVFVGGMLMDPATDYTINGAVLTFTSAPANQLDVLVTYIH